LRIPIACLMMAVAMPVAAHEVDESYSVSRRFAQYSAQYPGITWPAIRPMTGQQILLDRVTNRWAIAIC
jgi:hypothetical protein